MFVNLYKTHQGGGLQLLYTHHQRDPAIAEVPRTLPSPTRQVLLMSKVLIIVKQRDGEILAVLADLGDVGLRKRRAAILTQNPLHRRFPIAFTARAISALPATRGSCSTAAAGTTRSSTKGIG